MQYILLLVSIFIFIFSVKSCKQNNEQDNGSMFKIALQADSTYNFKKAIEPIDFIFPDEHLPHNKFKLEWWYFTGNLFSENGQHFGYQFTLFRNALSADSLALNIRMQQTNWATNQMYFAHFAITDVVHNKFYKFERFARGIDALAGASSDPLILKIEDWTISFQNTDDIENISLNAKEDGIELQLELIPLKNIVLHGNKGLSQKSNTIGNSSYYYSYTRLQTIGTIEIGSQIYNVTGLSWMDREWSSSILEEGQEGWDWFSLQFKDTSELMYFRLRDKNDINNSFAKGTYILKSGQSQQLSKDDVIIKPLEYWTSPKGNKYPIKWEFIIPKMNKNYIIEALIPEQFMDLAVIYWEGAVRIYEKNYKHTTSGYGYMEMTGY